MRKIFVIFFGFSFLFLVGCSVDLNRNEVQDDEMMVGNDRDTYGCIGSAGYSWCETLGECVQPWETDCESLMGYGNVDENISESGNVESEGIDVDYETTNIEKIYSVLTDIKNYGEAKFGEIIPTSIVWRTDSDKFNVDAYGINVVNSDKVKMNDMEKFFMNDGWTPNYFNMADGTMESMEGFEKDDMVCLVFWKFSEGVDIENYDEWLSDISVKCGRISE